MGREGNKEDQTRCGRGRPFTMPPSCPDQEGQALINYTKEPLSVSSKQESGFLLTNYAEMSLHNVAPYPLTNWHATVVARFKESQLNWSQSAPLSFERSIDYRRGMNEETIPAIGHRRLGYTLLLLHVVSHRKRS